jgi:cysteinyl-tRNA synthetase
VHERRAGFLAKMDDDFNTGGAVSELFDLVRTLNRFIDQHKLEEAKSRDKRLIDSLTRGAAMFRELTSLLGLFREPPPRPQTGDSELVDRLVKLLIDLRAEARSRKDFALADRVRDGLNQMGITLEDRKDGTIWRIES